MVTMPDDTNAARAGGTPTAGAGGTRTADAGGGTVRACAAAGAGGGDPGTAGTSGQRADTSRLAAMLREIADISEPGPGVTRLAYTALERQAHELVRRHYRDLGLKTWVDTVGNTIAELPGSEPGLRAIGTGSHLDSVPHGGRFDGIAGVVAAAEAARLLSTGGPRHRHPLRFVAFAAEEGARFGQACLGSKAAAGLLGEQDLWTLRDRDGVSLAQAMSGVGLDPARVEQCRWDPADWAAFLELHVEQGGTLEAEGLPIGIVDLVSGSTRVAITCTGRATHTGSTPMMLRADALAAAAEIVLLVEDLVKDSRHHGARGTVGVLRVEPGSITTIPGRVYLTVDVRDIDSDRQRQTVVELLRNAHARCQARGVSMQATRIGDSSPVVLPVWVRQAVASVCTRQDRAYRVLTSGASHDCQMVNHVVPSGLFFVPSRAGLSHVPEEWTAITDLAAGVDVLVESLLSLDGILSGIEAAEGGC